MLLIRQQQLLLLLFYFFVSVNIISFHIWKIEITRAQFLLFFFVFLPRRWLALHFIAAFRRRSSFCPVRLGNTAVSCSISILFFFDSFFSLLPGIMTA